MGLSHPWPANSPTNTANVKNLSRVIATLNDHISFDTSKLPLLVLVGMATLQWKDSVDYVNCHFLFLSWTLAHFP